MSRREINITAPELVEQCLRTGKVRDALAELAEICGSSLEVRRRDEACADDAPDAQREPILYRGREMGSVVYADPTDQPAAGIMRSLVEHLVDREAAVGDLVEAMMTSYEELDVLYTLLPNIATKVDPKEIGRVLVAETARTLRCQRVSLLMLDEKQKTYRVLAAQGLPDYVHTLSIPLTDTIAAKALFEDDLLVVENINRTPQLRGLSKGHYDTTSFAVVRVPLKAHGEALGILTATERMGGTEFTARDRKLLEGLSAMGASALMNCRLHAAVNRQMMSTIHALASAVDAKDEYTHDHAGRVAQLSVSTARELGVDDQQTLREVELAGLLHDIGKIGIPDRILSKPQELTTEEFAVMRSHVTIGARIVEHVPGLEGVADAIRHHHERFDGVGYPDGLSGKEIPLASRLIAAADTFDALTSDRPYRKAGTLAGAIYEMRRCRRTQLDPDVVDSLEVVVLRELAAARGSGQSPGSGLVPKPPVATI